MSSRTELFYTFGNHHHWVDMEWLWGYDVMSGSALDMLAFCRGTGAKGNANWEGGGYEKVAAEQPEAFAEFRAAVQDGTIEIVGGSYGQPYGLFQGDESNIRQMVYGVRAVTRLFGKRPRSFWEEEFYFFPQLPQILRGVGYKNASLYFQWTWHTPEMPYEDSPAIWWEGQDGSRIKAISRNRMNIHQWPEDIQTVFEDIVQNPPAAGGPTPVLLQWLELMPTKDWMCRSEVLLPKTKELLKDERFTFKYGTLSDYLGSLSDDLPVRRYGMDDVWHGMSLGKNGDEFRWRSRAAEQDLLTAESLSATLALFGRPYAQWDVYPTWELEEAWRELLMAQHHDNDECEGLCGHVGKFSYDRSISLSGHVQEAAMKLLAKRVDADEVSLVVYNPLPWQRDVHVRHPDTRKWVSVKGLPPMGYRAYAADELEEQPGYWTLHEGGAIGRCGEVEVTVGPDGSIRQFKNSAFPEGLLKDGQLLRFEVTRNGEKAALAFEAIKLESWEDLLIEYHDAEGDSFSVGFSLMEGVDGLNVFLTSTLSRPDPGMQAGLTMTISPIFEGLRIFTDQPLGQQEIKAEGTYRKKYPTGDWMTSPQWFEEVQHPFTGSSFVDLQNDDGTQGLLVTFDRTRQWFRDGDSVKCLLNMYDPWDEDYFEEITSSWFHLIPHKRLTNAQRYRLAQELDRQAECVVVGKSRRDVPSSFAGPSTDRENVAITAFYREMESAGRELDAFAGQGMGYPYVLRLLELNGETTEVSVRVPGTVAKAVRSNLLGEPEGEATFEDGHVRLKVEPFQIATVYLDIEEGRKQVRDLDAHRNIWAQVHRE
jgi:alpha-mannosidase